MTPSDWPYGTDPSHPREVNAVNVGAPDVRVAALGHEQRGQSSDPRQSGPGTQMNRETPLAAIAKERAIIAKLKDERYLAQERLSALERQIQTLEVPPASPTSSSNREKLTLLRRLFRGRTDIYPTRWKSPKTGKKGYSPVRRDGH